MSNQADSAFAPSFYLFQANAAALAARIRRPADVIHTEGSASLTAIGGRASAEGKGVNIGEGALTADYYRTEVTGDFVDLKGAALLTDSHRDTVSNWKNNQLEITSTTECLVRGFEAVNFDHGERENAPKLCIGDIDFKMDGRHGRRSHDELEIRFSRLAFSEVFIKGKRLNVTVRPDIFDHLPTFDSFKKEFNRSGAFRKEFGHMVYKTAPDVLSWLKGDELHDRRGYGTVTVVNKIEWADPKDADPKIEINGHSLIVPGYGTIYLGEMTIAPAQRRLHMVRIELGCRFGGSMMAASGCPGGHEQP